MIFIFKKSLVIVAIYCFFFIGSNVVLAVVPIAEEDIYSVEEDGFLFHDSITGVLSNDSDSDNDSMSAVLVDDVVNGILLLEEDGGFIYAPDIGFSGTDSFTYYVLANSEQSNIVTVNINVLELDPVDSEDPSVPTGLDSSTVSGTWATLLWNIATDDVGVVGYRLYRSDGGVYTLIADVKGLSFIDSNLEVDSNYNYKITAYDEAGNESEQSTAHSVSTLNADSLIPIFNTTEPVQGTSGFSLNSGFAGYARQFDVVGPDIITEAQVYLGVLNSSEQRITVALYEGGRSTPSDELFSVQHIFTPEISGVAYWLTVDDIVWPVTEGDYWIAVEIRPGDSFNGFIPVSTPNDIVHSAVKPKLQNAYRSKETDYGLRLFATAELAVHSVSSSTSYTNATITWATNENSNSVVEYGVTNGYGLTQSSDSLVKNHIINIENLLPITRYYFRVSSTDSGGNTKTSDGYSFVTGTEPPLDSDDDGIPDSLDKCPDTPLNLVEYVNQRGCLAPKADFFDISPDFYSLDVTEDASIELGISDFGKIRWNVVRLLTEGNVYNTRLDFDSLVSISGKSIYVDSLNAPILNSSATLTMYNITETNPLIKKDGVACSTCVITDFSDDILEFTVDGFSTYTVEETPVSSGGGGGGGGSVSSGGGGGGGGGGGSSSTSRASTPTTNTSNNTSTTPSVTTTIPSSTTVTSIYTRDLALGSTGSDVTAIQDFLISKGFLVMPIGVSKGYFGPLTQSALISFQKSRNIIPANGYFGAGTISKVNQEGGGGNSSTTVAPASTEAKSTYEDIVFLLTILLGITLDQDKLNLLATIFPKANTTAPVLATPVTSVVPVVTAVPTSSNTNSCIRLTQEMWAGHSDSNTNGEVTKLQNFLVAQGILASSAPRGYYGQQTATAVEQYQLKYGVVKGGTLQTTGFGGIGPGTRSSITKVSCGGV